MNSNYFASSNRSFTAPSCNNHIGYSLPPTHESAPNTPPKLYQLVNIIISEEQIPCPPKTDASDKRDKININRCIQQQCLSNPMEAQYIDDHGRTILHLFCCISGNRENVDSQTIQCILNVYPEILQKKDLCGRTPLFLAIKNNLSLEIVQIFFQTYPSAIQTKDLYGTTPLSFLLQRQSQPSFLRIILALQPSLAFAKIGFSFSEQMLLSHVFSQWEEVCTHCDLFQLMNVDEDLKVQWEKLILIIRAAYRSLNFQHAEKVKNSCSNLGEHIQSNDVITEEEEECFHTLHAVLEMNCCPPNLCKCLVRMHPEAMKATNANGFLPLHIVCMNVTKMAPSSLNATRSFIIQERLAELSFLSRVTENDVINLLFVILNMYPNAASIPDPDGRFVLHMAVESGKITWENGLELLLQAAPDVLDVPDKTTGLLPFMTAATASRFPCGTEKNCNNDRVYLNTVYNLLREGPAALKMGIGEKRFENGGSL